MRQIKAQLTAITKKEETWLELTNKVAHFDENLPGGGPHGMRTNGKDSLHNDGNKRDSLIRLVVEQLKGVNKDTRRIITELEGVTKDVRRVAGEVKDLSNNTRLVMNDHVKMNQCMNSVPIRKNLKENDK